MNVPITRGRALVLLGSALLLPGCSSKTGALRIGSTGSAENATIAEIYALALQHAHVPVERRMNFGDDAATLSALERGELDLYPGVSGETQAGIISLAVSPAADSPCLITSQYVAETYWLLTLSECARLAPRLRLSATREFLAAGGPLERLRHAYGGFEFKAIVPSDPGTQTYAVARGDADIADTTTTQPEIAEERLVILYDDKKFWPRKHIAPVIRSAAIHQYPRAAAVLNRVSPKITQYALQQMNLHRQLLHLEPRDVAEEFVRRTL